MFVRFWAGEHHLRQRDNWGGIQLEPRGQHAVVRTRVNPANRLWLRPLHPHSRQRYVCFWLCLLRGKFKANNPGPGPQADTHDSFTQVAHPFLA